VKNALFASAVYLSIYRKKKERKQKEGDKTNKKKGREMAKWEEASIYQMHASSERKRESIRGHAWLLSLCVLRPRLSCNVSVPPTAWPSVY
jgi:hypothetical protein